MKFFLGIFVILSVLALSHISIHAYEDTYMLECDIAGDNMDGLVEEVYASPATLSAHPEAASGVFGARTEAGRLMNRRDLQTPLWAAAR